MSDPTPRKLPKYRHYKPKDLAVVRIDGRDHYLGKYDSPESHEKYRRLLAEWLATGQAARPQHGARAEPAGLSINELILAYWRHADRHYRGADGTPSGELDNMRDALRPVRTPSELRRQQRSPGQRRAPRYDRRSYRQAIVRACDRAFPHPTLTRLTPGDLTEEQRAELQAWRREHRWSPLQLRHTAATAIRSRFGLEAAQTVLGHARADVTQVYAERDLAKAHAVMAEIG
jgi:hypothetical protein